MATEEPATLVPRIAARAIDVVIVAGLNAALGQVIGFGFDWLLLGAGLVWAYFAGFDAALGATPGKLALGLRILGPEGGHPTPRQALIREAFTLLGAIPFVGPLIALGVWIWIAVDIRQTPLRQGRHDTLAGGTRVVRLPNP